MTAKLNSTAVMARRHEAPDSLDLFPTPPWATRALIEHVLLQRHGVYWRLAPIAGGEEHLIDWSAEFPVPLSVWEPAAGKGHMAAVLKEYFADVRTSDVFDYGELDVIGSFVGRGCDSVHGLDLPPVDFCISNPPFNLACEFVEEALPIARQGVAMLVRSAWAEGQDRYARLFANQPPAVIAQFVERVPMVRGRWDPQAVSATAYAWFYWNTRSTNQATRFLWIPPGCRARLTKPDDRARFAAWSLEEAQAPLWEGSQ